MRKLPPQYSVHRLQFFELSQGGSRLLGVLALTFKFRDGLTLTGNILATRLDMHLCLCQMEFQHLPVHQRTVGPESNLVQCESYGPVPTF